MTPESTTEPTWAKTVQPPCPTATASQQDSSSHLNWYERSEAAWPQMLLVEPRLRELVETAESIRHYGKDYTDPERIWCRGYGNIPPFYRALSEIIHAGRLAARGLNTSDAWTVGKRKILEALKKALARSRGAGKYRKHR